MGIILNPSAQNQVVRFQALLDELVTRYNEWR